MFNNILDDYTWKYVFGYLNYSADTMNASLTCKQWYQIINVDRIKITNLDILEDVIIEDDVYSLSFVDPSIECFRSNDFNGYIICKLAAKYGKMNCLRWACENGCEWDNLICAIAAENGHLNCLEYLHENDCKWNWWTCMYAAENGHLDCLRYAHENNCPWDRKTYSCATKNNNPKCLIYFCENDCECSLLFDDDYMNT